MEIEVKSWQQLIDAVKRSSLGRCLIEPGNGKTALEVKNWT